MSASTATQPVIERVYNDAEQVVASTNDKVRDAKAILDGLRKEGVLEAKPFQTPIDFAYFDLWHYYGRTSKHGAFMGGADFVQWHGNYELNVKLVELKKQAEELRAARRDQGKEEGRAKRTSRRAG